MPEDPTRVNYDEFTRVTFFIPRTNQLQEQALRDVIGFLQEPMTHANELYKQHGKSLEPNHSGEYVAISHGGAVIAGKNLTEVSADALSQFGSQSFTFEIGGRVQNPEVCQGLTHSVMSPPVFIGFWWDDEWITDELENLVTLCDLGQRSGMENSAKFVEIFVQVSIRRAGTKEPNPSAMP